MKYAIQAAVAGGFLAVAGPAIAVCLSESDFALLTTQKTERTGRQAFEVPCTNWVRFGFF